MLRSFMLLVPLLGMLTACGGRPQEQIVMGALNEGRWRHTATLLPDGKVLIAGGDTGADTKTILASAELFDPTTNQFTRTGSMTQERTYATATLLRNGKVLVLGGYDARGDVAETAELYDPATGTFRATGPMAKKRYKHTATLLPDGRVLVVGGYEGYRTWASAEVYDPATERFTHAGTMAQARYQHSATLLPSGKVLVAGGWCGFSESKEDEYRYLDSTEVYDPATGRFTPSGSLGDTRCDHAALLLPTGKVLITDGYHGELSWPWTSELYDPATGTCQPTGAPYEFSRHGFDLTLLPSGKVLAVAGASWNPFEGEKLIGTTEVYDPALGTFRPHPATLAEPRCNHTTTLLKDGRVLVVGGGGLWTTKLASAEIIRN